MVLGYIRTINIDADILLKSEQLDRLKSVKCDEIVEEEVEKISENIADRLSSRDILVIESLNVLGKMTGENLQYIDKLLEKDVKINILDLGLIENNRSMINRSNL